MKDKLTASENTVKETKIQLEIAQTALHKERAHSTVLHDRLEIALAGKPLLDAQMSTRAESPGASSDHEDHRNPGRLTPEASLETDPDKLRALSSPPVNPLGVASDSGNKVCVQTPTLTLTVTLPLTLTLIGGLCAHLTLLASNHIAFVCFR